VLRLSSTLFNELRDVVFVKVAQRAMRRVALEVFHHLHALSLRFHLERQTGGLTRDIERGTRGISTLLSFMVFSVLPTVLEMSLVTGFLIWQFDVWFGVITVAAIVIYFAFKDRSRYVRYHAMQSFLFQLLWWVGGGILTTILWVTVGVLAVVIVGLCLIPFALVASLLPLGALIYGVIGGIQVSQGQDFRYWLVGDWVRGELTGD